MFKSNFLPDGSVMRRHPCRRLRVCGVPPRLTSKAARLQQQPHHPAATNASFPVQSNVQLECTPDFIYPALSYCLINTVHAKQRPRRRERPWEKMRGGKGTRKEKRELGRERCCLFSDSIFIPLFWENNLQQEAHYSFIPLQLP